MRVNKYYKIIVVPSIVVIHYCVIINNSLSWKSYYEFRNQLDQVYNNLSFFRYICYVLKYKMSLLKYFIINKKILCKKRCLY